MTARLRSSLGGCAALMLAAVTAPVMAAPQFDLTRLEADPGLSAFEFPLDVAAAGAVELELNDLGAGGTQGALGQLAAALSRNGTVVARLDAAGRAAFTAAAGRYVVHVAARTRTGQTSGLFGGCLIAATGAEPRPCLGGTAFSATVLAPAAPPAGVASVQRQFVVTNPGTYRISLVDQQFPAPLSRLQALVTRGATTVALLGAAGSTTVTLAAGAHSAIIALQSGSGAAGGLAALRVEEVAAGAAVLDADATVGAVQALGDATLSVAGNAQLRLADLGLPTNAPSLAVAIVRDGGLVASRTGGGTAAFVLSPGVHRLFLAAPAVNLSYSIGIEVGGTAVLRRYGVRDGGRGEMTAVPFNASSGAQRVEAVDFQVPGALKTLRVGIAQGDALVASLGAAGSTSPTLSAGPAALIVFGEAATAGSTGAVGYSVAAPGGAALASGMIGVGADVTVYPIDIPAAAAYDLRLTDLGFPTPFSQLNAILADGTSRLGVVIGGGTLSASLPRPGRFALGIMAQPQSSAGFGLWSGLLQATAPTLQLTVTPTSIEAGGSVQVQWSSTATSSCTASGAWTGSRPTSGSAAVTLASSGKQTVALSCDGPGGSVQRSAQVDVAPKPDRGGGGSFGLAALLLLSLAAVARKHSGH